MNRSNKENDSIFYHPWAVETGHCALKNKSYYSFPDFHLGYRFSVDDSLSEDYTKNVLEKRISDIIAEKVRNRELLQKPIPKSKLLKKYGYNCDYLKLDINMWDIIDRVYPPKEEKPKPILALPPARDVLHEAAQKEIDLNFWVAIEHGPYTPEDEYHVSFPEIIPGLYHIVHAQHLSDFWEQTDQYLLSDLKTFFYENKGLPKKMTKEEVYDDFTFGMKPQNIIQRSIEMNDYLDVLRYYQRSQMPPHRPS